MQRTAGIGTPKTQGIQLNPELVIDFSFFPDPLNDASFRVFA